MLLGPARVKAASKHVNEIDPIFSEFKFLYEFDVVGLRRVEGGPGLAAQEADGGPRDQDEADHHQGRAFEKGTYNSEKDSMLE